MKKRIVNAAEFKAKCLALLHDIEERGDQITITRKGRAVAIIGPTSRTLLKSPIGSWADRGRIVGDIVNDDMSSLWEVARHQ